VANTGRTRVDTEDGVKNLTGEGYILNLGIGNLSTIDYSYKTGKVSETRGVNPDEGKVYAICSGEGDSFFLLKILKEPTYDDRKMKFDFRKIEANREMVTYFHNKIDEELVPNGSLSKDWRNNKDIKVIIEPFACYAFVHNKKRLIPLGYFPKR